MTDLTPTLDRATPVLRILGLTTIAGLLAAPAIGMRLGAEGLNWTAFDFLFAGAILGGAGIVGELVLWRSRDAFYRLGAGLALVLSVGLIWINGAVGVIGSENEPANLLFGAVLLTAAAGAVLARFRAAGLSRAMFAAAIVQVGVPVAALGLGLAPTALLDQPPVLGITIVFTVLWLAAAAVFGRAARAG